MTSELDTRRPTTGERRWRRAYLREFLPGIVAYVVLLPLAIGFGGLDGTSPWRFLWALVPVVPMVWVAIAIARHLRRVDEYQREKLLTGLAIGFGVAMLAAIVLGMLERAGLTLEGWGFWAYLAGMLGWGVSAAVLSRR